MICRDFFRLYGRLGRAAKREWTERHSTDYAPPVEKFWLHHWTKLLWNKLPEEVISASSVSAFISRLNSTNVSFLMFCFSAVCFFICVSFDAVVKVLFEPFRPVDTVLLFRLLFLLHCICVDTCRTQAQKGPGSNRSRDAVG